MENKLRDLMDKALYVEYEYCDCGYIGCGHDVEHGVGGKEELETLINESYVRKDEEKHLFTFNTAFSVKASSRDEARKKAYELTGWRDDHLELTGLEPKTNTNKEETKHGTK